MLVVVLKYGQLIGGTDFVSRHLLPLKKSSLNTDIDRKINDLCQRF